ncbi:HAD-IA family hydrolase [Falsiroseomonas selenitidurans]|uniref:phosphoglycolate phosphatase n=1 Tax=Falsiroseomonas selenitidurans TaxID=2716335 RepID=A0ABX1DXA8_9PROT|nr:HAD-IA family hydrolase [Falsiroseomonas selenitidurans]NKC29549.1 HAD-IA family hydrolase [Falsiroseomonas selenitidurans]
MDRIAVFDLDGTLVDSAPDLHAALDRLMAARGLPGFRRAEVVGMIGDGAKVLVERALAARGATFDPAALDSFLADYGANAAVETAPFDGISAALDTAMAAGWRLAVCTNKPVEPAITLLRALGLAGRFAAIGGGDSYPVRKPDPAHLLATLRDAGGTPAGAVMIGDHHNDMAAAAGAGVKPIFAGWGYGPRAMAGGAPIAERPRDLAALLAAIGDG